MADDAAVVSGRTPASSAANRSLFMRRPDAFGRFAAVSVLGHGVALLVFLGVTSLLDAPKVNLDVPAVRATVIRRGARREASLLPRKEAAPAPRSESVGPSPTHQELLDALDRARGIQSQQGESRRRLLDALHKATESAGEADGDPDSQSSTQEGDAYFGQLSTRIKQHYDVSAAIPETERLRLRAAVQIRIGPAGELIQADIWRSSRNELFDLAVLAAVRKAQPFPRPPAVMQARLQTDGVTFEFSP